MSDLTLGVVGASGALGREILAVLDQSPWRPDRVVALARATTSASHVEYGEDQIAVDVADEADLGSMDALIVATPREAAGDLIARAVRQGLVVVDAAGSRLDQLDTPLVLPWLGVDALDAGGDADVACIPGPAGTLVASLVGPLVAGGVDLAVDATVMLPASAFGRDAVQELSGQVVALLNAGTPPRRVFPQGLAFDVLPQVGEPGATGWTDAELRTAAEIHRLTGVRAGVQLVGIPLFSGVAATFVLRPTSELTPEAAGALLQEAGVEVVEHGDVRRLPRPRRVEGTAQLQVARLRQGFHGQSIQGIAALDNLRMAAAAAVGTAAQLLRRRGRLGLAAGEG